MTSSSLMKKLHRLLSLESPTIVSWTLCGKRFQVLDVPRFEATILNQYFRLHSFSSFNTLLTQHGFSTSVDNDKDAPSYTHATFCRDQSFTSRKPTSKVLSKPNHTRHRSHPYKKRLTIEEMTHEDNGLWTALALVQLDSSDEFTKMTIQTFPLPPTENPLFQKSLSFETIPDAWQLLSGPSVVCV
ncbi:hypothetical protein THRCLA_11397 [Thraustotheca clavata]|uniref:HSF-type DNA-binding domain-containing protein n=1 Tax=Thraustotheca clavata TaxID=74557 RepID=A0A1V9Y803_9STRA|nr:hypothetical protein THRCLA_11397 [Thraustotheca clavata]